MRIGIVTGEYPPMQGGVGAYSHVLAQTFVRQGHSVSLFSSQTTEQTEPEIPLTNTVKHWGYSSLHAIKHWAKNQQLDVINLQFQTAAFDMSPWIHFLPQFVRDVPVVTTFHDLRFPYLFPKAGSLRNWIVLHLARTSAGTIVTNHEDLQQVKQLPHVQLIPIGSNILTPLPADFDPQTWREKAGSSSNELLLAHFGFINRSKGITVLLKSLAQLRKEGIPVRLLMIGGRTGSSDPTNAAFVTKIDALIEQLGLTPFIHWTGFVDDEAVSAYLTAADIVTLPFLDGASYRRGSLMAAIHHGCTIITTTPQVEIPTFIHGENLHLIPPDNEAALTTAIRELQAAPKQRTRLQQGAVHLNHCFDWSQIAHDCVTVFERAMS